MQLPKLHQAVIKLIILLLISIRTQLTVHQILQHQTILTINLTIQPLTQPQTQVVQQIPQTQVAQQTRLSLPHQK
jgi:hypothetical protein